MIPHPHLTVIARDSRSVDRAQRLFKGRHVVTAPDVILTLNEPLSSLPRYGVVTALRFDDERELPSDEAQEVIRFARTLGPVAVTGAHIGDVRLSCAAATAVLRRFRATWPSAEVVITDRLHSIIFAVITGTLRVALDSGTGKVGLFCEDWLKRSPTHKLIGSADLAGNLDIAPVADPTVLPAGNLCAAELGGYRVWRSAMADAQ